jgi:hemolysin activation/secretion protein
MIRVLGVGLLWIGLGAGAIAQVPIIPPADTRSITPPMTQPALTPRPTPSLPLQKQPPTPVQTQPIPTGDTIVVKRFVVQGSTVFSPAELDAVLDCFRDRPITFVELLQARSAITKLYADRGYVTTGAYIPEDNPTNQNIGTGTVVIQVVEGRVEKIRVNGLRRLNPSYIQSRLGLATGSPLQEKRLLEALQLLQLDPLIHTVTANLTAGTHPGSNILDVTVEETNSLSSQVFFNNGRSPSVGSDQRGISLTQANLLGIGDSLSLSYTNTQGSNAGDLAYSLPINPRNGSLSFTYSRAASRVIERPFDELDITSNSTYYQVSLRQPIVRTPTTEVALGLAFTKTEGQTTLLDFDYPLSPGADDRGRTRISALRFFQEWTQRSARSVLAVRSQFSFGLNAFDATINAQAPDSRFFTWRGQAQWVRLLGRPGAIAAPTLVIRGDIQLADRSLLSPEQFGLGGADSVRGYRQDVRLTDSGAFGSVELRVPVLRIPEAKTTVLLIPFAEVGTGWDRGDTPVADPRTLASVGLGLQLLQADRFNARLNWGIPLNRVDSTNRTWQERGLHFSIEFRPF